MCTKFLRDFLFKLSGQGANKRITRPADTAGQGQPWRTVLLPILFLLSINVFKPLCQATSNSLCFAANVSLFCSHPSKLTVQAIMQEAIKRSAE